MLAPVINNRDAFGCERLWRRVILQAVQDADSNIRSSQMRAAKHHARAWLTSGSRDFAMVCEMAGLHPQKTKQCFRRYFQQADSAPFSEIFAFNRKGQLYVKYWH